MNLLKSFVCFLSLLLATLALAQEKTVVTVQVDKPISEIQPTMWGIFFEDINFAADGGLYAELVKNRSFEFASPLMGWKEENHNRFSLNKKSGNAAIINRGNHTGNNPRFARITINHDSAYALVNEGFQGMGITKDIVYDFSVLAREAEGQLSMRIELIDDKKNVLASTTVDPQGGDWKKYQSKLTSSGTVEKANLRLSFTGKGVIDLDLVSLFPVNTWKNRPGGLRADLVQLLYDLKPGFLRFPGGCIVEGRDLSQRYQWKKTVGAVDDREVLINRWNNEFQHRPAPDYFQSFGLGFFEYFQLAEDLGAAPLPILSCGMACQFNTAELVPLDQLDPYIQDALDLIEFANGATSTRWGKLRADMGHPIPFNLTMIGVGNEQWGPDYFERYKQFESAIRSKYPSIKIVSSSGPGAAGEFFEYAWEELKSMKTDLVDEHYYQKPEWFLNNASRYDQYDRKGPKVFAGEYAAQSVATVSPENKNNWQCALAEAAFMTGLERNAEIVHLASYAPLFAHTERWQWTPNLIWFNNLTAFGTPSYYVQKLFSTNKGTHVLPASTTPTAVSSKLYTSAVWDAKSKEVIVKLVNASDQRHPVELNLKGLKGIAAKAAVTTLTNGLTNVNTIENPKAVYPVETELSTKGKSIQAILEPNSVSVIKIGSR